MAGGLGRASLWRGGLYLDVGSSLLAVGYSRFGHEVIAVPRSRYHLQMVQWRQSMVGGVVKVSPLLWAIMAWT